MGKLMPLLYECCDYWISDSIKRTATGSFDKVDFSEIITSDLGLSTALQGLVAGMRATENFQDGSIDV